MSILPRRIEHGSASSSSSSPPQTPPPDHGLLSPLSSQPSQPQSLPLRSHRISDSPSESLASSPEASGGPSKEVNKSGKPNGKKSFPQRYTDTPQGHLAGQAGAGLTQSRVKMSGNSNASQSHQASNSVSTNGSTSHSAGKKSHMINGNHLLNFHYDPISRPRPQPRPFPPRRQQKIKPYNKDLFLQANYRFVMLDSGNSTPESMDPDKSLQWDNIICLRYSTPLPVSCPICLEDPLCPQITSCGHIFCFPCILRYFLMDKEDDKGDCWKKCPLCFMKISPKDLYTIYLESVEQYHVGDIVEFMLLTRPKDSFSLSLKNNTEGDGTQDHDDGADNSFSRFMFTTDVDLSVRKAISDLDSWLARADGGLVDDLEKLPYVCAALEQLEQRKKYWNEIQAFSSNKSCKHGDLHIESPKTSRSVKDELKLLGNLRPSKTDEKPCLSQHVDRGEFGCQDDVPSTSYYDSRGFQTHPNFSGDNKEKDSYNFYQVVDGQHIILHPLNMKCLLHHYGSYDMLPPRICGKVLQLEIVTQSEAMRRRYRYLSHFSLTTTFQLCEIDLSTTLPSKALSPFMDEIKKRQKQRKRLAKKEEEEIFKVESSTLSSPIPCNLRMFSSDEPPFSIDDFEALGNPALPSSSPPIHGERNSFSNVARFGFAAGHDSPSLKIEEVNLHHSHIASDASAAAGSRNASTLSFAKMISKAKPVEPLDSAKMNDIGKKGKKANRVLLSTASGRRY
ncbi:Zinc finger, C3HC4 RING-type [Dillenia turbinata]|uniref:Zinc finger, C3HC4 RING-type n=1 Tax=Dillenia turbinata TaxID=194707 RepID=A0AAN8V6S3_9MAGN